MRQRPYSLCKNSGRHPGHRKKNDLATRTNCLSQTVPCRLLCFSAYCGISEQSVRLSEHKFGNRDILARGKFGGGTLTQARAGAVDVVGAKQQVSIKRNHSRQELMVPCQPGQRRELAHRLVLANPGGQASVASRAVGQIWARDTARRSSAPRRSVSATDHSFLFCQLFDPFIEIVWQLDLDLDHDCFTSPSK